MIRAPLTIPLLALGGFLFAAFIVQGLPYWDVDYTVNFTVVEGRSLVGLIADWISPFHAPWLPQLQQGDAWGFLDRAAQFVVYRISYQLAGYDAWPYLLFKSLCYAGLGVLVYLWGTRLASEDRAGRSAALAAAAFFLITPGPVAALVWLSDFAPAAELAFLALTFLLWREIERTPAEWDAFWPLDTPAKRRWVLVWIGLSLATYLAYKTKADLKLIPILVGAYVLIVRRRQWRLFAVPLTVMVLLAIPWGTDLFAKPPPFAPGAAQPAVAFFWRPASLATLRDFLWSAGPYDFGTSLRSGSFTLAGLFGPFLLLALFGYALWRTLSHVHPPGLMFDTPRRRARLFAAVWLATAIIACSALPVINDFFRIRYGIITLVPACILLGWLFSDVIGAVRSRSMPAWAAAGFILLACLQAGVDLSRALWHRAELGPVMVAVDRAYAFIARTEPASTVVALRPFRPYDYRHDIAALQRRRDIASLAELSTAVEPRPVIVVSWDDPHSPRARVLGRFNGCRDEIAFDRVMRCPSKSEAVVLQYVPSPEQQAAVYAQASAALQRAGKYQAAIAAAREALRIDPRSALAYNNLAAAFEALHEWDDAIRAARAALRLQPDFPLAKNNLEWSLAHKRRSR